MKKIYFKLFEVVSDGVSRTLSLPTGDILRNSNIIAIEAYNPGDYGTKGVNQTSNASITDCYLKLVSLDNQVMVDMVPLQRINPKNNMGNPWKVDIPYINPSDCQIVISGTNIPANGSVFQIGFYYEKLVC